MDLAVNSLSLTDNKMMRQKLTGLKMVNFSGGLLHTASPRKRSIDEDQKNDIVELNLVVSDRMSCSYCNAKFSDRQEQVLHYKSDFHRYNLKQSLKGAPPVNEDEFEAMAGKDAILSSISGSDSTSDNDDDDGDGKQVMKLPLATEHVPVTSTSGRASNNLQVFFRTNENELISMYRCVLHGKKNIPETERDLAQIAQSLPDKFYWTVLMAGGGHFAAAVFDRGEVVVHKTFHRYTVRAKRGTAQGLRDSQGNAPKSAGASLRRYNEAALVNDTQELLQSWSEHLKNSSVIFVRAPSYNRSLFFGHKNPPLDKQDPRVRMIPFPTRRPTFKELKRVHSVLSTITNYGTVSDSDVEEILKSPSKQKRVPQDVKSGGIQKQVSVETTKKKDVSVDSVADDDSDSGGEIELMTVKEILTTIDLKMYEATRKPKRGKKKKKKEKVELELYEGEEEEVETEEKEMEAEGQGREDDAIYDIRNSLYTAACVGDFKLLQESLSKLTVVLGDSERTQSIETDVTKTETSSFDSDSQEKPVSLETSSVTAGTKNVQDNNEISSDCDRFVSVVNQTFGGKKETLLHIASKSGKARTIIPLLEAGVDPSICNTQKLPPYCVATTKEIRNEYRRFMARYPEKYNYVTAQVPSPLTEEMEEERKSKEAERKKAAKKAKQTRQMVIKAKENEKLVEEREKQRFLQLSDREKRALAAEKRFLKEMEEKFGAKPVLSRCWQCGADITGKVPFEYYDYKFCTTKCLQTHRKKSQDGKS